MAGVYPELRLRARASQMRGARRGDASLPTASGYRVRVKRGCGVEFTRWVTTEAADEDLLRSALLAFEN